MDIGQLITRGGRRDASRSHCHLRRFTWGATRRAEALNQQRLYIPSSSHPPLPLSSPSSSSSSCTATHIHILTYRELKMVRTLHLDNSDRSSIALRNLSQSVANCKKIVVVTGAGISCSSNIPVSAYNMRVTVEWWNVGSFHCRILGLLTACTTSSNNNTLMSF